MYSSNCPTLKGRSVGLIVGLSVFAVSGVVGFWINKTFSQCLYQRALPYYFSVIQVNCKFRRLLWNDFANTVICSESREQVELCTGEKTNESQYKQHRIHVSE